MVATLGVNAERMMMLLIAVIFIATSANLLSASSGLLTSEEAIKISQEAALVREGMRIAGGFSAGAKFYNSSMVNGLREGWTAELFQGVPLGHSVWRVAWGFSNKDNPGGYLVIVIVDADAGTMIYSGKGVELD